jgi:glycosyltransferase involved in cell wall biosynthesis
MLLGLMRLAVYTDYKYRRDATGVYAEKAFTLFLARLADELDGLVLLGRLDPHPRRWHYRLPDSLSFVPLPWYPSLARPLSAVPAMVRSVRRFWRALDDVDGVWVLGPHLLSLVFLVVADIRGKRVFLGARQDLPRYVANRHPDRRTFQLAALVLEGAWRLLSRRHPIIVVGPDLERRYRRARAVLGMYVSLVEERSIDAAEENARDYSDELSVLAVGRLEREKNPLLLADVLARLREREPRWRLIVCGDGPMRDELADRLDRFGVADHAELRGYVPMDGSLARLYRDSHLFLHVSWTEGVPQVLLEAFAAGLPTVATAVGGVAPAAEGCAMLIPPGDASGAAEGLATLARDQSLRERLTDAGIDRARRHTVEAETRRVADFLRSEWRVRPSPDRTAQEGVVTPVRGS